MTVEIVGEDPKAKLRRTCSNCAAILQFTPLDLERRSHTDYGGDTEYFNVVVCPRCGRATEVKDHD